MALVEVYVMLKAGTLDPSGKKPMRKENEMSSRRWRGGSSTSLPPQRVLAGKARVYGWLMIAAVAGLSWASVAWAGDGDPAKGKGYYTQWCSPCHGESGKGDGTVGSFLPTKPRNHTDDKLMSTLTDQVLFETIKGGGAAVKKSPVMPSFGPPAPTNNWQVSFNDQQIWDLVSYVRTLHRGNSAKK